MNCRNCKMNAASIKIGFGMPKKKTLNVYLKFQDSLVDTLTELILRTGTSLLKLSKKLMLQTSK